MTTSNAYRFGADQGSGDDRALFLTRFWGEVLVAFRKETMFYDNKGSIIAMKNLDGGGKSWTFPILGDDPDPEYHTPGDQLLGQTQRWTQGTITIDDILVGHRDIPLDQRLIAHWDVVQPYATAIGRAMAIRIDHLISRQAVLSARTAAVSGYHNGGNIVSRVAAGSTLADAYPYSSTGASNFLDDCSELAQLMDEDNVPRARGSRWLFIPPRMARVLTYQRNATNPTLFSEDYRNSNDLNSRVIAEVEGFNVVVSNNMPASSNYASDGPPQSTSKYDVDCRYSSSGSGGQPAAIALCGASDGVAAMGMVEAFGITPDSEVDKRRNTLFIKAQTMFGLGTLAPWCAGVIQGRTS